MKLHSLFLTGRPASRYLFRLEYEKAINEYFKDTVGELSSCLNLQSMKISTGSLIHWVRTIGTLNRFSYYDITNRNYQLILRENFQHPWNYETSWMRTIIIESYFQWRPYHFHSLVSFLPFTLGTIHKIRPLYESLYEQKWRKWKISTTKNLHNDPYTCSIRVIIRIF